MFTVDDEESAGVDTLASIVRFTDEMCSIALRLSSSHAVVEHMVLTFYETVQLHSVLSLTHKHQSPVWGNFDGNNLFSFAAPRQHNVPTH